MGRAAAGSGGAERHVEPTAHGQPRHTGTSQLQLAPGPADVLDDGPERPGQPDRIHGERQGHPRGSAWGPGLPLQLGQGLGEAPTEGRGIEVVTDSHLVAGAPPPPGRDRTRYLDGRPEGVGDHHEGQARAHGEAALRPQQRPAAVEGTG
jgi:hypothetical protein